MIELPGYDYLEQLGDAGNFGTVFRARNVLSGHEVAIKHIDGQLDAESVARWEAEASAMARCDHDNVVRILHAEVTEDGPALVMEYLAGGSVEARYGGEAAPVNEVCDIISQACWGLHRLHVEGLTHRDIKPANLLMGGTEVKVGDFGLAAADGAPVDRTYVLHTPPEVRQGQPWTPAADLYALGATAWRLLWGDAQNGRDEDDIFERVNAGCWPNRDLWPDHVHKRLRTTIRAALHPNPDRRPRSASDFRGTVDRARPRIGWVPDGDGRWRGNSATATWSLRVTGEDEVVVMRNKGRGMRVVPNGRIRPEAGQDGRALAAELLELLALTGST